MDGDIVLSLSRIEFFSRTAFDFCINVTNVEDIPDEELIIYPNPADDKLVIRSGMPIREIKVLNLMANPMQCKIQKSEHEWILDTSFLPAGMYFVKLNYGNSVKVEKFVIQR
jgi:hypothetical protein